MFFTKNQENKEKGLIKRTLDKVCPRRKEKKTKSMMNENYMYLHCDAWESHASMNPCYDNRVYRKRAGRRAMWKALKQDIEDNVVEVDQKRLPDIREAILEGNPEDANEYILYAHILNLEEAV